MNPDNPVIVDHTRRKGLAAVYENGYISILEGDWILRIEKAVNCPVTMAGMAPFMIANTLAACLACFAQGVDIETIRRGVRSFNPSAQQTPGRMNLFDLGDYKVLLDYAHNPHGYEAVGSFVRNWQGKRIGVIGGPGDRRDEDLILLGKISAQVFDQIIIKEDQDKRDREPGEVADLIAKGVIQEDPNIPYKTILDEVKAMKKAFKNAEKGNLVVIFPENVTKSISIIEREMKK